MKHLNRLIERFATTLTVSAYALGFSLVFAILMPIALLIQSVPLAHWGFAFVRYFAIVLPLATAATILSAIYQLLTWSGISRVFATIIFGIASPSTFLLTITASVAIFTDSTLHGLNSPKGLLNLGIIYLIFGIPCGWLYWKKTR